MLMENLLFCIPLFIYKHEVEKFSNIIITSVLVTPFVMGGLAYFYFRVKGHPWTRILNEELRAKDQKSSDENPIT